MIVDPGLWKVFCKGQRVDISGFVGCMVFITATHSCLYSLNVAIQTIPIHEWAWLCHSKTLWSLKFEVHEVFTY